MYARIRVVDEVYAIILASSAFENSRVVATPTSENIFRYIRYEPTRDEVAQS
jgi:hypothetical protein